VVWVFWVGGVGFLVLWLFGQAPFFIMFAWLLVAFFFRLRHGAPNVIAFTQLRPPFLPPFFVFSVGALSPPVSPSLVFLPLYFTSQGFNDKSSDLANRV